MVALSPRSGGTAARLDALFAVFELDADAKLGQAYGISADI
jgi:hypothetical protein